MFTKDRTPLAIEIFARTHSRKPLWNLVIFSERSRAASALVQLAHNGRSCAVGALVQWVLMPVCAHSSVTKLLHIFANQILVKLDVIVFFYPIMT